jgi:hypothetical protein
LRKRKQIPDGEYIVRVHDGIAHLHSRTGKRIGGWLEEAILDSLDANSDSDYSLYIGRSNRDASRFKIGITNDFERRRHELDIEPIKLFSIGTRSEALEIESEIHDTFKDLDKHIEQEWFALTNEDVAMILDCETTTSLVLRSNLAVLKMMANDGTPEERLAIYNEGVELYNYCVTHGDFPDRELMNQRLML